MYLETSDDEVLENISCALAFFACGDHARKAEAQLQLKNLSNALKERLLALATDGTSEMHVKRSTRFSLDFAAASDSVTSLGSSQNSASIASGKNEEAITLDTEHSLSMCLKRLRVLSKRCNIANLLEIAPDEAMNGMSIENFCTSIGMMTKTRLEERQVASDTGTSDPIIPLIWTTGNQRIHDLVAKSVNEALSLLLSIVAWQTSVAVEREEGIFDVDERECHAPLASSTDKDADQFVLRLRGDLVKLLQLCWEQCLDGFDLNTFSEEHIKFADSVQQHACQIAGDLRSLFPKEWADSPSSLIRAFALTDDGLLVGGSVRYLRSKEDEVRNRRLS